MEHAEGGILALGTVTPSAHWAVWLNIKATVIAMEQQDQVANHQCWQLKCNNPWVVERYTKSFEEAVIQLQAEEKVDSLYQSANTGTWPKWQEAEYNDLDTQLIQAKLNAERHCQNICAGQTPWMPAVTQAIQHMLYWKGVAKCSHNSKISMMVLKWCTIKGQLHFSKSHWKLASECINQKIKEAYSNYL